MKKKRKVYGSPMKMNILIKNSRGKNAVYDSAAHKIGMESLKHQLCADPCLARKKQQLELLLFFFILMSRK